MPSWREFETECPDLAGRVRRSLDQHRHKVLATLRTDGSPRVSGVEVEFFDGDVWIGSMPASRKAADLTRDPRCAVHGAPADESMTAGDAKLSARAIQLPQGPEHAALLRARAADGRPSPDGPFDLFRLDLTAVALTGISAGGDQLRIESWTPATGYRVTERA